MDVGDVVVLALESDRLSKELADEVLNYGISELLIAGASYSEALKILERAEEAIRRSQSQAVTFGARAGQGWE